ncbi:MAG: cell division protein SepF, partial [Vagococcus sp.]
EEKNPSVSDLSSSNQYKNKKVVEMNAYQSMNDKHQQPENRRVHRKITVFEPRAYADCKAIAQALFRKEIVIITFSAMEEQQARRVVDFVTGTIFAVDGDIQRIGEEIFICTPANVELDSSVAQSLISTHLTNY